MPKFDCPSWATSPPTSVRLHVFKNGEKIETLSLGEKKFYRIGRQKDTNDVVLDHLSISRHHAALCHGTPESKEPGGRNYTGALFIFVQYGPLQEQ